MYDTAGCIAIASEYGCGVYANVIENISFKKYHMKILSCLCLVRTQDALFDAVEFQQRYHKNPFVLGDACLTPLYQHV